MICCVFIVSVACDLSMLTHLPLIKMTAISQTIFSDAFSWMKSFVFWLKFHWGLFLSFLLAITQHCFRYWVGAEKATSHYLNQCWPASLMHICSTRAKWVNCVIIPQWQHSNKPSDRLPLLCAFHSKPGFIPVIMVMCYCWGIVTGYHISPRLIYNMMQGARPPPFFLSFPFFSSFSHYFLFFPFFLLKPPINSSFLRNAKRENVYFLKHALTT